MIEKATLEMVEDLSKIHSASLPNDLLPKLGKRFLRKIFFPLVIKTQGVHCLVALAVIPEIFVIATKQEFQKMLA
jgi:hypothetical protein